MSRISKAVTRTCPGSPEAGGWVAMTRGPTWISGCTKRSFNVGVISIVPVTTVVVFPGPTLPTTEIGAVPLNRSATLRAPGSTWSVEELV